MQVIGATINKCKVFKEKKDLLFRVQCHKNPVTSLLLRFNFFKTLDNQFYELKSETGYVEKT